MCQDAPLLAESATREIGLYATQHKGIAELTRTKLVFFGSNNSILSLTDPQDTIPAVQHGAAMIYLNNAATSYPKPQGVIDAMLSVLQSPPAEDNRGSAGGQCDGVGKTRHTLARFIGAAEDTEVIFTSGATEALNGAILGLCLDQSHVVTTAAEHTSVLRPLTTLEHAGRILLSIAPCDRYGQVHPGSIEAQMRPDTRLVVVTHRSNVTGALNDIATIATIAHRHGALLLVDASQSAGDTPLDVTGMKIDMLALAGHKSLYGPSGIGALFLRRDLELTPLKTGGTGVRSDLLLQPPQRPHRYEAGTRNLAGIAGLGAGIEFVSSLGIAVHAAHKARLCHALHAGLSRVAGVSIIGFDADGSTPTMLCFVIDSMDPDDAGYALSESCAIVLRSGLHCAPLIHGCIHSPPGGVVRVSPSWFTTDDDIASLIDAVAVLARAQPS